MLEPISIFYPAAEESWQHMTGSFNCCKAAHCVKKIPKFPSHAGLAPPPREWDTFKMRVCYEGVRSEGAVGAEWFGTGDGDRGVDMEEESFRIRAAKSVFFGRNCHLALLPGFSPLFMRQIIHTAYSQS